MDILSPTKTPQFNNKYLKCSYLYSRITTIQITFEGMH